MKCPFCGADNRDDAELCSYCGSYIGRKETEKTVINQTIYVNKTDSQPRQQTYYNNATLRPKVKKKPFYERWWFWLIVVVFALSLISSIVNGNKQADSSDDGLTDSSISENHSVWANKTTSINDFNYYIDGNEIIIKEYKGNDDKIKISSTYTIDGKKRKVTSFSDAVFIFDSVESVILPNGTKHLEANMFNSCGIKYLYIPKSVKSVDDYFWDYFHNMEKIYYQGTEKEWKKLCKVDRSEIDVKEIICNTDSSKLK